jgi:DNA repair protein RAD5
MLERKIYDSIWLKVKQNFDQLEAKGLVSKNYTHILAMLMRLVDNDKQNPHGLV